MLRNSFIIFLLALLGACNSNIVETKYKATKNGVWNKDETINFSFNAPDTISRYNVFINLRNDNTFPYSNLFLISELSFPNGTVIKDTLEYQMAKPNGEWLGKGNGSVKENKLWLKENIVFPENGVYTLQISQAMRKNGNVNGIVNLEGITDVGYQIEKIKE